MMPMNISTDTVQRKKKKPRFRTVLLIGAGVALLLPFVYVVFALEPIPDNNGSTAPQQMDGSIQTSTLKFSSNGRAQSIEYFHCSSQVSPEETQSIVLLHGSSFTKKNWKTSGILETLCEYPNLSVSAMDLPVSAGHGDLEGMLSAMKDDLHIALPVVLVTPSASGKSVVDWVQNGNIEELPDYVGEWIPIASYSVLSLLADELASMADLEHFKVFAINGDRDKKGGKVSSTLKDSVGAKTLELEGGHSVYLDSPVPFSDAVVSDLGVSKPSSPPSPVSKPSSAPPTADDTAPTQVSGSILTGNLTYPSSIGGDEKIEYFHCAFQERPEKSHSIVLLHGSSFTKKNWKTSGILETLCEYPNLSVSAMDLPVSAGHGDLEGMLLAMKDDLHIALPVVLVTPSASGKSVVDWVQNGNIEELPDYVGEWIPVASYSVLSLLADELASMADLEHFKVFAINGDGDKKGGKVSSTLKDSVGAKTLELEGGHSVYLDSPVPFSDAVVSDLGVTKD